MDVPALVIYYPLETDPAFAFQETRKHQGYNLFLQETFHSFLENKRVCVGVYQGHSGIRQAHTSLLK